MTSLVPMLFGINWMDPNWLLAQFGSAFFWVSAAIVVIECGLFFPFLPGDTLLFAMGLFIAGSKIQVLPGAEAVNLIGAMVVLGLAAFGGNIMGYEIGRKIGPPIYERNGRFLKRHHFDKTAAFFDKHGNKALVLGRFVPFVRTYVTVVAGVSRMERHRFSLWSGVGATLWVAIVTLAGYFLGAAFPSLAANIDKAIIAILLVSLLPIGWEWWRHRRHGKQPVSS